MQPIRPTGLGKNIEHSLVYSLCTCVDRHDESPLEIERRRRGLSLSPDKGRVTSSTLEQSQELNRVTRQRRQTEEAEETKEAEEAEEAESRPRAPPSELSPEQERGRRQTSDPDQLCPTLASFVMPRAAVNSQGDQDIVIITLI